MERTGKVHVQVQARLRNFKKISGKQFDLFYMQNISIAEISSLLYDLFSLKQHGSHPLVTSFYLIYFPRVGLSKRRYMYTFFSLERVKCRKTFGVAIKNMMATIKRRMETIR